MRDVRKIFVKPQTDSDSLENVSRMSRESSEVRPIISRPIHELFAYFFVRSSHHAVRTNHAEVSAAPATSCGPTQSLHTAFSFYLRILRKVMF